MMRVVLDTNVVLDAMLQRVPWHVEADAVIQAGRDGRITTAVAALTIANVFYIARRLVGLARARQLVRDCLLAFEVLPADRLSLEDADLLPGSDFEDNIQIAVAQRAGVDAIVTRDPSGFAASPVPVLTPADLNARLPPPPP